MIKKTSGMFKRKIFREPQLVFSICKLPHQTMKIIVDVNKWNVKKYIECFIQKPR